MVIEKSLEERVRKLIADNEKFNEKVLELKLLINDHPHIFRMITLIDELLVKSMKIGC